MKISFWRLISVFISLLFLSMVLANSARAEIIAEDIVGIWLFDDDEENVAVDSSGNGHEGSLKEGVKWTAGKFANALEFPGLDGVYVAVPPAESLDLSKFTITAWVKMEMVKDRYPVIVAKFGALRNYGVAIQKDSEVPYLQLHVGGQYKEVRANTKITDNEWHHIAASYDMEFMRFYVDGVMEAQNALNGKPDTVSDVPLSFGGGPGTSPALGIIDEIGIFNIGLTVDDINDIMSNGLEKVIGAKSVSTFGKLAALWSKVKVQ